MYRNIEELVAVFWDGLEEGTLRLGDFESWMRDAGAPGTIAQWRHSLAQWFPERAWDGDIDSDFERLWDGQFTTVTGMVKVQDIFLTNADDFSALTSIGGPLYITSNASLENVDGFSALTSVGSDLYIYSNAVLENADGFSALTSLGGNLDIYSNDVLTNVDGFSALTSVGSILYIENNDVLSKDSIKALKDRIHG